ncbi:MAG: DUF3558 domain-containing protein [Actinophytocola sp.]|uniref:DUF3558 domain-containing protein n=1 Tax=Actinophytocola sp. TaxID=1872138 RepID=UPI003C72F8A2
MSNRLARITILAIIGASLASCTTTAAGNPVPDQVNSAEAPTSETSPSGDEPPADDELPSDGAPKVRNPLDASHFEKNPCDALTAEQANALNVDPAGTRSDTDFGPGCAWRNPDTGGNFHFGVLTKVKRGLSDAYRSNENGTYAYFKPIADLEGFPAVAFDTDKNPTVQCSVVVGLTDQRVIQTLTQLSSDNIGQRDSCEVAIMATGETMKTIKAGS